MKKVVFHSPLTIEFKNISNYHCNIYFEKKKNNNLFLQSVSTRIHVLSIDKNLNKTWSQEFLKAGHVLIKVIYYKNYKYLVYSLA